MTTHTLPQGVQAAIARGEVPPPRGPGEPYDEIRDLKLAVAIATDAGDHVAVSRLNAQMIDAMRRGETTSWRPPQRQEQAPRPKTRDDLMREARQVEADEGLDPAERASRAERLKALAMHAPEADASQLLAETAKLDAEADRVRVRALNASEEEAAKLNAEAAKLSAEADRVRVRALAALRGDVDVAPAQPPTVPMPSDINEFNAAIAKADEAGDHTTGNRLRAGMLAYRRAQQNKAVEFASVTPDHAGGS